MNDITFTCALTYLQAASLMDQIDREIERKSDAQESPAVRARREAYVKLRQALKTATMV